MKKLSSFLDRIATLRITLLVFVLFLLTTNVIFPWASARLGIPPDAIILDTQLTYSPAKLYQIIDTYGEAERQAHALFHLTADVVFPIVYLFALGTLISYTFQQAFPEQNRLRRLNLAPFWLMVFDFLENTGLIILLQAYPRQLPTIAHLTGWITTLKWCLSAFSMLIVLVGIIGMFYRWVKYRNKTVGP